MIDSKANVTVTDALDSGKQDVDADLTAISALSTTGLAARTGSGTYAVRTLTGPAAGISVSDGDGVAGDPTLALTNDLSALEALSSTGIAARTGSDTWAQRTITGTASQITVADGDGASGNPTIAAVIASQGEAEAGTDSTSLMTPQRVSQAIAALGGGLSDVVDDTSPQLGGDLDVNGNAIVSVSNGDIEITPNGSGAVVLDGISWPTADGTDGQVLKTDGAGALTFEDDAGAGGGLSNIAEDTTPQLGGDLDVNGNAIVSVSAGDIAITPDTTGEIVLDGVAWPQADGSANQYLKADGSAQLSYATIALSELSGTGALAALDTVDTAQIDNDAITSDKIDDDAVVAAAIADDAVITAKVLDANITLAKMADLAQDRIIGRVTASTGVPEALTAANVRTIINVEDGSTADQSDSEIETAYNNQVDVVGQAEAEAGASTTVRRWTAERVGEAIAALATGIASLAEDTTPQLGGDLDVNGNSIVSVSNGDIAITPNGSGSIILDGLSWPQADGTDGQVLKTDGSGQLAFEDDAGAGGGLSNVADDTTPQLGGDLDVAGNEIVSVSAGDIVITPDTTGEIVLDGVAWPQADGSANQYLKTDGSAQLSYATIALSELSGTGALAALDTVDTAQIDNDAVTAAKVADDAILTAAIIDNAVTTAKILNANVTTAKIAADAVDGTKIADDAVDTEHLADDAVVNAAIADDAVDTAQLADGAVDTDRLGADAVTAAKIADDAVDTEHLAAGAVDRAALATRSRNAQTGTTYTLALSDENGIVSMNNASASTLTIPANASIAFPVDAQTDIFQFGAGALTVEGDTGVTVNGVSAGGAALTARYTGVTLVKVATNEWVMMGSHGTVA
jgi:hypothetical protein